MSLANHHNVKCRQPNTGNSLAQKTYAAAPLTAKAIFTVRNHKGLHTRPATELVMCTSHFDATAHLTYRDVTVSAKSLLGILMLAAGKGAKITVEAEGHDAKELVDALLKLADSGFNMAY